MKYQRINGHTSSKSYPIPHSGNVLRSHHFKLDLQHTRHTMLLSGWRRAFTLLMPESKKEKLLPVHWQQLLWNHTINRISLRNIKKWRIGVKQESSLKIEKFKIKGGLQRRKKPARQIAVRTALR